MKSIRYRLGKQFLLIIAATFMLLSAYYSFAAQPSIVGKWNTFNAEGKQTGVIQIGQEDNEFRGKVIKLLNTVKPPKAIVCTACEGNLQNKPVLGMTTLWGLHQDGDEWVDGKLLDPQQGKIFNCKATLSADGKQMNLRIYKGTPMLGKTRTWVRQAD